MIERKVDVAVIGAGTAGLTARREVERSGKSVVMIEDGPYGTTCARVGCMPSKLLIAAADLAHEMRHSAQFGVHPGTIRVDGPAVLERVRRERDRFSGFVVEAVERLDDDMKIRGRARFVEPTVLEVDDHIRVVAGAVVVATGSRPIVPASIAGAGDRVVTSDQVFEIEDLPASVAVIGTGIIGLELGQALTRLGVRTTFLARSENLAQATDPVVREVVREVLSRELDLHFGVEVSAEKNGSGCRVRWRSSGDGSESEADFDMILATAGRTPNLDGLGLEKCGVELDSRGIPVFDHRTMQCGSSPIFIAGDVTADRPLLHEAADEGHIAGANAARYPDVRARLRRVPLSVTFTDPQIAIAGQSYRELDLDRVEIGEVSYDDQGRARVMAKNAGIVRLYADRECGTLVGAEMFGPRVENTSHLLAWAIQSRLTVGQALDMPFYHPVVEEGIRTGLRDLCGKLKVHAPPEAYDLECGPGT